jgi:glutamyl-Q tRNA(Asp) synthetase
MSVVGRFAPSATGPAHPGTLLAGLLAWLDVRADRGHIVLRVEDLDPARCTPEKSRALVDHLAWFGLDFDAVEYQTGQAVRHATALDRLAESGWLYPCHLSRSQLAAGGRRAPDGAWAYDNRARGAALPPGGWRLADTPLRAWLPDGVVHLRDDSGEDLSQKPTATAGDPVVWRRDGAVAYQLACVVDDAAVGVTRVVRGRDIAPSTATQVALQQRLGLPQPTYRHHALLLEVGADRKLSKFH